MSMKEFALLRFFASRIGQPVTREEILTEVWGTTHHIDRNVVDQYVSYLRRKLDDAEPRLLRTVRGFGYQLRADGSG